MSGNGLPNNLPILEGKNWERWSKQMKSLFGFQESLEVVTNGLQDLPANATEAHRTTHKDLKKKDCKAMYVIQAAVDSKIFDKPSWLQYQKTRLQMENGSWILVVLTT